MEWIRLERVGSTSEEVQKLLPSKSNNFAISAKMQTKGRGQRGRDWQSPEGNVYLSIALQKDWTPDMLRLVPLQISIAICEVIQESFGIGLTVRWPNDLLFSGKKLAGILCESSTTDTKSWVIVGIGLNVSSSPKLVDQGYEATCLKEHLNLALDPDRIAESICQKLESIDFANNYSKFKSTYEYWSIRSGHLFRKEGKDFTLKGFGNDGARRMQDPCAHADLVEHSGNSEYRWNMSSDFILFDVGNTWIKLQKKDGSIFKIPASGDFHRDTVQKKLQTWCGNDTRLFGISVNETGMKRLRELTTKYIHQIEPRPIRLQTQYDLSQLGVDRWALLEGALKKYKSQAPMTLVSLGTAITVDRTDASGIHLGGQIAPGLTLMQKSLSDSTDQLPLVHDKASADPGLGFNTENCINFGNAQLIQSYLNHWRHEASEDELLILSGGGAKVWEKDGWICDNSLVFEGIRQWVLAGL